MTPKTKKISLICFSGDHDKLLSAFSIACSAATDGYSVNIFLTFWGLNIIKSTHNLPLSRFNWFGMGSFFLKKRIKKNNVNSLHDLYKTATAIGINFYAIDSATTLFSPNLSKHSPHIKIISHSKMLELAENGQIIHI